MGQPPPPPPWPSQPPDQSPYGPAPYSAPPPGQAPFGPQPHGQPGYAPPPPGWPGQQFPPAQPPRRGGGGKVVVVLLVVGLGLTVLCGGGATALYFSGAFRDEDPVQVIEDYYAAAQAGDCDRMVELVTEDTWQQNASSRDEAVSDCETNMAASGGATITPVDTWLDSESGDTAVVGASFPLPEVDPAQEDIGYAQTFEVDYTLRKEGINWRIDGTADGGLEGIGAPPAGDPALPASPSPEDPGLPTAPPPDGGGETEVNAPTAAELWGSREDFTFEIETEERTLTGRLQRLDMYDHPDCASAAVDPGIAGAMATCVGRIEAAYVGENDGIRVSQLVFTFADESSAVDFVWEFDAIFAPDLVAFTDPGDIANSGYSESTPQQVGPHVVITLMVSSAGDDASVQLAQDHAHAMHSETVNVFAFGGP